MEYDLARMGSAEFEDLAVALCNASLGIGGQTFGTGRDGGREWTHQGTLPLPELELEDVDWDETCGTLWNGYSVIQAKHKSRLEGGKEDVDWLLTTIQKEVNAWLSKDKDRQPKPRNLLFITNVRLSAVPKDGGIDRVSAAMKKHAKSLDLHGWAIWHSAHVSRLLDNHPGIRQTYLGLILTGDLMSEMLQVVQDDFREPLKALTSFVVKELLAQSTVRPTKAGGGPNKEHLYDIGIDLPAQEVNNVAASGEEPQPTDFAANMISFGNSRKDITKGRFCTVLVGGPGQGKSTVGQLICQAYRAAILEEQADSLPYEHRAVLKHTLDHLKDTGIPLPRLRRWPMYVRLSEYSERIIGQEDYSLLAYITDELNKRVPSQTVQKKHVHAWLKHFPWMLVLDGLDEVPDTATRTTLFSKISDFMVDAAEQNADISILATTRRQGYENDLRTLEPREFELIALNTTKALNYARQLVTSRHSTDPTFADDIHSRLTVATQDEMTAKLMGTPLQVSIMASLLEDRIRLPRTRHALFDEFYNTIFRRESNKLGMVGKRVLEHQFSIDALHNEAGILLHVQAEKTGQADAHLTTDQLRILAENHLCGTMTYEPADAARAAKEIIDLATDRLILLIEPSSNQWGFELRSFQEYMASKFLVAGDPLVVMERLKVLAKSTHWRNTWLFAAGQVFDKYPYLRPALLDLVADLDTASTSQYWAKTGSVLAGDLLQDNFAADTPGFRRQLILRLTSLIDTPVFQTSKLVPILHAASENDHIVYQKIRDTFDDAIRAGGARKFFVTGTMRYWLRHNKGGISAYVRSKVSLEPARKRSDVSPSLVEFSISRKGLEIGIPTRELNSISTLGKSFYETVRPFLNEKELTKAQRATLSKTLKTASVRFVLLDDEKISFATITLPDQKQALVPLFESDVLLQTVVDACLRLPDERAAAFDWFLSQVSQAIGQDFVDEELQKVAALPSL